MPIQTNFARESIVFHKPIMMTPIQMHRMMELSLEVLALTVAVEDEHVVLRSSPSCLVAYPQEIWDLIGEATTTAKQPWWEFALLVEDDEEYTKKVGKGAELVPHSHALSLIRVYASGEMKYLYSE